MNLHKTKIPLGHVVADHDKNTSRGIFYGQDSTGLEKGWAPHRVKHLPVFIQGRCLCTWGAGDAWSAGVNGWPIPATALGGWVHGVVIGRTVLPASNLLWAPVALSCVSRCVRIPAGPKLQS